MNARVALTPAQEHRKLQRHRDKERMEIEAVRAVREIAPELVAGTAGAGLSEHQLRTVLNILSQGKDNYQLRAVRRTLRRLLSRLEQESGGQVAKPAMEITLRRRASPFAGRAIERVRILNRLLDTFLDSITTGPTTDPAVQAGQIMVSAVVHGGLLARQLVLALPPALKSGLGAHGDLFWLDIVLDDGQLRRWFPDPVTSSLIARWHCAGRQWPRNRKPLQLLSDHLKRLAGGREAPFRNFNELRAAAEARLRLTVPGLLVDHLSSVRQGQSLPSRAWWRLLADYQLAREPAQPQPEEEDLPLGPPQETVAETPQAPVPVGQDDVATLRLFMKALRGPDGRLLSSKAKALQRLRSFRENVHEPAPMLAELMHWAIWLLEPGKSPRLRPSSVYRYLSSVAASVLNLAGEIDPTQAKGVEMEHVYESVLQTTHSAIGREMAVSSLRSFHLYLVLAHGVEDAGIDGQTTGHIAVRANVISDAEFAFIRDSLRKAGKDQLALMLVLFYRLGLRRSELRYVRLSDFQIDKEGVRPLLWIHSHPDRRTKSSSSVRRMPLQQLLTVQERAVLHDHYKRRLMECRKPLPANALLFAAPGNASAPVPDGELDEIVEVMREACQDPTLVLHSLRHAFVSNLFGDNMRAGLPEADQQHCMPWRIDPPYRDPLAAMFRNADLPREMAHTIAVLAGHLGPAESLHSYVHLHDYFAYMYLRMDAARHPAEVWARLEGVRTDSLHVRASRQRARGQDIPLHLDTPARLLKRCKIALPEGKYADRSSSAVKDLGKSTVKPSSMTLDHVYWSISRSTLSMSHHARELVTGFSKSFQGLLQRNGQALASLRTSAPRKASRRPRLIGKVPGRRRPAMAHRPQLDRHGPALPRSVESLREARLVFQRIITDETGAINKAHLLQLLQRSSHTKPWVRITRVQHARHLVRLLGAMGVPYSRMKLRVDVLPPGCDRPTAWLKHVKTGLAVRDCLVELARPADDMPRSRASNPEGVLHLDVYGAERRSTGWRVGCYYAVCYYATCNDKELSEVLAERFPVD